MLKIQNMLYELHAKAAFLGYQRILAAQLLLIEYLRILRAYVIQITIFN